MANLNDQNPNRNQTQKKKKKGSGAWGLAILALVWLFNSINSEKLSRFFSRLKWSFRTGNFSALHSDASFLVGIGLALVLILLGVTISRAKKVRAAKRFDGVKAKGGGTAAAHSHDRLQGYRGNESAAEHWKKQLDGFLEAGIIDRSEYRVLMERRRR